MINRRSNKKMRGKLKDLYGQDCFIEKLGLRKETEARLYTSKGQYERMKQLTYHHMKEKGKRRRNNNSKWSIT